jgi:hypothetical protein
MSPSEPPIPAEVVTGIKPLGPRIVAWSAVLFLIFSWVCLALTHFGHRYDFVAIFYIPGLIAATLSGFASGERPGVIAAALAVVSLLALGSGGAEPLWAVLLIKALCASVGLLFGWIGFRLIAQSSGGAANVLVGLFLLFLGLICVVAGVLFPAIFAGRAA